ncbi:MAG: hypothetical protein JJE39_00345, partial [Vicinamibacteria bacterium]|nr:hypothetical protein [Vicinamibacteria bacterium]
MKQDKREAQAVEEAGHTEVRPALARFLSAAFLALLLSVTTLEIRREAAGADSPWRRLATAHEGFW